MKFFTIACIAAIIPTLRAQSSFQDTCNDAITSTNSLTDTLRRSGSLLTMDDDQIDEINGYAQAAINQLINFENLFQSLSSEYSDRPWEAKDSQYARRIEEGAGVIQNSIVSILSEPLYASWVQDGNYAEAQDAWLPDWGKLKSAFLHILAWPSPPGSDSLPQVSSPQPSPTYGLSTGYGAYRRRSLARRTLCPVTETACRISNATAAVECLDTQNEITSCGGCVSEGKGENCLEIAGAGGVGFQYGRCVVLSLAPGYKKDRRGRPVISGV